MTQRERFIKSCYCQKVDRPPLWLMRQAGRALPEYRALKEKRTFLELVRIPELACEVTLQPIRRFGFDAAILFSDILVIPEALGQSYEFRETGGIQMSFALDSSEKLKRLSPGRIPEKLQYSGEALKLVRKELDGKTALIGFAGSPWTLANFMAEGGSAENFTRALAWYQSDPAGFERFLSLLTRAVIEYARLQIEAGVDAIQIFDSLGGLLHNDVYEGASGRWLRQIACALSQEVPVIIFSKRPAGSWQILSGLGAQVLGLDNGIPIGEARRFFASGVALQGNLDPAMMLQPAEALKSATTTLLDSVQGRLGFILNLGHGLPATTPVENIQCLVEIVRNYSWVN